jgi:hypothetical protein
LHLDYRSLPLPYRSLPLPQPAPVYYRKLHRILPQLAPVYYRKLLYKPRKKTKELNQGTLTKELSPRESNRHSSSDSNTCSNSGNQH